MSQPLSNSAASSAPPASSGTTGSDGDGGTFGKIAIQMGFITQPQLDEAILAQQAAKKAGLQKRIGDILMKKGYLTPDQLNRVLKGQKVSSKQIGNYQLMSKLGEGGMGAVFKAKQIGMERLVALKILSPKMAKNKSFRDRFFREARAVAKLNHRHIVSGIDVGTADGYYYFAMEFVDGESLGQHMMRKGGRLDEASTLTIVRQVAEALQHAHDNNLLHRDVKPDNVLIEVKSMTAKLADLGLARTAESAADDAALTQAGQAVGTPFYISPEQARGLSDLTPATDLYSLGASMYHLLTGQVPYDGATAAVIMTRHLTDPVPSPRAINSNVSAACDRIVQKLMQKDPRERYRSANDLVADIDKLLNAGSAPESASKIAPSKPRAAKPSAVIVGEREVTPPLAGSVSGGSSNSLPAPRGLRRRRTSRRETGLGVALILVVVLAAALFLLNPGNLLGSNPPRRSSTTTPEPLKRDPVQPQFERPVPNDPPAPPAVAARLQAGAGGLRTFQENFDGGTFANFEVDPLVGKAGYPLKTQDDSTGSNKVLKAALIRPIGQMAGLSGGMARLVLPANLQLPRGSTFSFSIYVAETREAAPNVRVWWDHQLPGEPRTASKWEFSSPDYKTGWQRITVTLGKDEKMKLPSREKKNAPQYIAIYVGAADELVEAYIDNVELVEGAAAPAESRRTPPPVRKAPEPNAGKAQETDAPAPPPAEKPAPEKPESEKSLQEKGLDALRRAL